MRVRFGYVAMSMLLEKASPSHAVTFKTYEQLAIMSENAALQKVRGAARENLQNTLRLLRHCISYGIKIYRFSSRLIPLATHPCMAEWDYAQELRKELQEIGDFVKSNDMRVSFHPDHFTLLNSPRLEVLEASLADLEHHRNLLYAMGLDERSKLIIHMGGGYKDKETASGRFLTNWPSLPKEIQQHLVLENDDRIYTAGEVLHICSRVSIPMVFDLHHHVCNRGEENLSDIIPRFIATWQSTGLSPKIHISSPKSPQDPRSHHEYVNPDDIYSFLIAFAEYKRDLDVMVEAKQKDRAMLKLVEDLGKYRGIKKTGNAELIIG